MSIKRLGRRTSGACVFPSPSEIPDGGFSPVRLETGIQPQPSPFCCEDRVTYMRLKSCSPSDCNGPCGQDLPEGRLRRRFPRTIPSRGPWLASGLCCPAGSSLTMTSSEPLPSARQLMDSLSSPPTRAGGTREGPQFTRHVCTCVPSPGPRWTGRLQLAVASPTALAFAFSAEARHPQCHASWFTRDLCNEADRFACATAHTIVSPSPTKDIYDRAFAGRVAPSRRRL